MDETESKNEVHADWETRKEAMLKQLTEINKTLENVKNIRRNSTYVSPYKHQREDLESEPAS